MKRFQMILGVGVVLLLVWLTADPPAAWAGPQERPSYTMAEYNAYNAAANDKNAQQRVKLLDDFVAKYPNSTLLPFAYRVYYQTYNELRNFPKVIEYVDREMSFGDKIDAQIRVEALYIRALAFHASFNEKDPTAREQAVKARDAAIAGLKALEELKKPEGMTDDVWNQNKKAPKILFDYTAGFAALQAKDYANAVKYFKTALADDPTNAVTYFRLGVAYLQTDPPQALDGFWALARSVALKGPGEAQVRQYLRGQLFRYQQTVCEKLLDDEMNELIALAANSPERPASFTLPKKEDLEKAREDTANFLPYLKEGGDKGKLMWLATCGLEYQDVPVKVLDVTSSDNGITLKVFRAATEQEMEAATEPNMTANVVGQPETKRLQKGDYVRFTGTLAAYQQQPFQLTWDKAKVNPEDIPEEKAQPGKRPAKRPAKKGGR